MNLIRFFPAILVLIVMLYSCGKDEPVDTPTPPLIKADTLTTGWTKLSAGKAFITDVFFNNSSNGYATTDTDILKSTDGGIAWTKLSGFYFSLVNIAVTPDGKLFVANKPSRIVRSTDEGKTFTENNFSPATNIRDVFFTDNNTGYTVAGSSVFQTTNGGVTWAPLTTIAGPGFPGEYNSLFILNTNIGWFTVDVMLYRSTGTLNNWVKSNFTGVGPRSGFMSVYATSASVVYAGNENRIYKSTDGGTNFSEIVQFLPFPNTSYLDIHFTDSNTGYACNGNRIYKTVNAGTTWTPVVSLGESRFVEIHFTDPTHGWGCTDDGFILRFNG